MFCKNCGAEIKDEAVICPSCGCETGNKKESIPVLDADKSKTGIGILCGLFLGLIGLIIGICLYKEGSVARKTFLKAWGITFAITTVAAIIIYAITIGTAISAMSEMYY